MERIKSVDGGAPVVGAYSLAIIHNGIVETAGQIALTSEGELVQDSVENETHQVMSNVGAILKEAGCTFSDVTFAQVYYTDPLAFEKINRVYSEHFTDGEYPARATVGQAFLPRGARVEISMRARVPAKPDDA